MKALFWWRYPELPQAQELGASPSAGAWGPMAEALAHTRERLPEVEELGEAYALLDGLAAATAQAYPQSLCRAGCGGCCTYPTGLFTVGPREWAHIEAHLAETWSPERRRRLAQEAMAAYGGAWKHLVLLAQGGFLEMLASLPWFTLARKACPFLEGGSCSIYPARPYACRAFGLTAIRAGWSKLPRLYACPMQGEALWGAMAQGPSVQLPVVNPIVRRIRELSPGPRSALPLWVVAWAKRELAPAAPAGVGPQPEAAGSKPKPS